MYIHSWSYNTGDQLSHNSILNPFLLEPLWGTKTDINLFTHPEPSTVIMLLAITCIGHNMSIHLYVLAAESKVIFRLATAVLYYRSVRIIRRGLMVLNLFQNCTPFVSFTHFSI